MSVFLKRLDPKIKKVLIIAPVIVSVVYYFHLFTVETNLISLKCPHEYSDNERSAAFKIFVNDYYNKNPRASLSGLLDARRQFWVDHNCQEELKGYDDYLSGNLDEAGQEKKKIVEEAIDEYYSDNIEAK